MRWKFPDPHDPAEARQRQTTVDAIDRWWEAFLRQLPSLEAFFKGKERWDLPGWVHQHLHPVHPRMMWEFGQDPRGGYYLVLTPESAKELRPLVDTVLARAPEVEGWHFYPYRQPEPLERVIETVRARAGGDLSATRAHAALGELHTVDVTYYNPAYAPPEEEAAWRDACIATESLLGEELLDKWVGTIEATHEPGCWRWLPLERYRETVEALVDSMRQQLPGRPVYQWEEEPRYTLFQLRPDAAEDYPARIDLMVAPTMLEGMWKSAHGPRDFYSGRFSRCGEVFCYLKIDGSEEMRFADLAEMHDAVDATLREAEVGCAVGRGTGLRYLYVDLAVTDVEAAMEAVRPVLREGGVARRSWLLFFDCEWAEEWVGVWEDTPAPPMLAE